MVGTEPTEVLSTLVQREAILYAVDVSGCDKREITGAVSVSRSTVDRSIRELADVGLVTRGTDGYRRTLLGELLLSEYYRFKSQTAELLSAGEVFSTLSPEIELCRTVVDDATIVTASQATPHEPVSELCAMLSEATEYRMYAPVVLPNVINSYKQILSGIDHIDVLLTDPVLSKIVSKHDDKMKEVYDTVDFRLVEKSSDSMMVSMRNGQRTQAAVLVFDDSRQQALIKNSGDAAVAWVDKQLNEIAQTGTPLPTDAQKVEQQLGG